MSQQAELRRDLWKRWTAWALVIGAFVSFVFTTAWLARGEVVSTLIVPSPSIAPVHNTPPIVIQSNEFVLPRHAFVRVVLCGQSLRNASMRLELGSASTEFQGLERGMGNCREATLRAVDVVGSTRASVVISGATQPLEIERANLTAGRPIRRWMVLPLLAFIVGVAVFLSLNARARPSGETLSESTPALQKPWSWVIALLIYVGMHAVTLSVIAIVYAVLPRSATSHPLVTATALLTQHLCMLLGALWLLGLRSARRWSEALVITPVRWGDVGRSIGLAFLLVFVAALVPYFVHDMTRTRMSEMVDRVPLLYTVSFGAVIVPISEEAYFRGVLLPAFGKRAPWMGVVASTALFTLAHAAQLEGALVSLVPILLVGLTNAILRVRTGGLTQSWIVHTAYNFTLLSGLYLVG